VASSTRKSALAGSIRRSSWCSARRRGVAPSGLTQASQPCWMNPFF